MSSVTRLLETFQSAPSAIAGHIGARVLISSEGRGWKDLYIEVFAQEHTQRPILVPAVPEPVLSWAISGHAVVEERELGGEWTAHSVRAGDFYLTHSETPYELRWTADPAIPFQVMHLYLSPSILEEGVEMVLGKSGSTIRLKDVSAERDEAISHLLHLVHAELRYDGSASTLFMEGLLQSLVIHLIRHYASDGHNGRTLNTLPGVKLRNVIAFMETHLDEPFDLGRLANNVSLSTFHFSRLFKRATGSAPSHFFVRQRIEKARRLLRETGLSITEIGIAIGYTNSSHFSQVFRREVGISPSDYRLS
jgi:AraC family transcriptional regulator